MWRALSDADVRETLAFIDHFIRERGFSPTFRDVGERFQVKSSSAVSYRLNRLQGRGLLAYEPGQGRTMRLTPAGRALLQDGRVP